MNRFILFLLFCGVISCKRNIEVKKCINDIPNLWMILTKDSTYHEFYFDHKQYYFFDGSRPHTLHFDETYDKKFDNFFELISNPSSESDTREAIEDFLYNDLKILNRDEVVSFKPIGNFIYLVSKDRRKNKQLFDDYAYLRWKGEIDSMNEVDKLNDFVLEEEIP